MPDRTTNTELTKLHGASRGRTSDVLVVEEPLDVRIGGSEGRRGQTIAVTMRTPGDDFDLAWGLAITERVVSEPSAIASAHWGDPADPNAVELRLAPGEPSVELDQRRAWLASSACGLCGKDSIDQIEVETTPMHDIPTSVDAEMIYSLPPRLRSQQDVFDLTGGLHAAGAFTIFGESVCVREDIGRHNAVDKVIGHLARTQLLPASELILVVSGRAGFEIVQKAAVARFPILVAVSAPSSLAVDLASRVGMTIAGFVRDGSANIYSGAQRIK